MERVELVFGADYNFGQSNAPDLEVEITNCDFKLGERPNEVIFFALAPLAANVYSRGPSNYLCPEV